MSDLKFIPDACLTVIQCRNVLKWTYAYGFYLYNDGEDSESDHKHKNTFEFWQAELQRHCDHLHHLVEKDLNVYLNPNSDDRSPFYKYKEELVDYATASNKYCNNLIDELEQHRL